MQIPTHCDPPQKQKKKHHVGQQLPVHCAACHDTQSQDGKPPGGSKSVKKAHFCGASSASLRSPRGPLLLLRTAAGDAEVPRVRLNTVPPHHLARRPFGSLRRGLRRRRVRPLALHARGDLQLLGHALPARGEGAAESAAEPRGGERAAVDRVRKKRPEFGGRREASLFANVA